MNKNPYPGRCAYAHRSSTNLFVGLFVACLPFIGKTQGVTGIITDYGGYWKTTQASVNPVKPDNSHNLLAFTWNGVQYATGANNSILSAHGQTFTAADWWAMNIYSYTGSVSGALVALGQMYDGVNNGASSPPPSNANFTDYLRDGIKGLDLGTGISNLPAGNSFTFYAHSLNVAKIGDGVPDLLITQIAQPGTETYEFLDASGVRVGNQVSVNFNSISKLGDWTIDFYNVGVTPMTLSSTYTKTDRELRLWAADLSLFGITTANAPNVARFRINMSGSSDFAFSAYNNQSIVISNTLPVTLGYFKARPVEHKVELKWNTLSETGSRCFVIEKSRGTGFQAIDSVIATGQSTVEKEYTGYDYAPSSGTSYYRLRIVDRNGATRYSQTVQVFFEKTASFSIYPNPASGIITVLHSSGLTGDKISLFDTAGRQVTAVDIQKGKTFTQLDLQTLPKGIYRVTLRNNGLVKTEQLVLQ
ncbi:MAG: hypothetical protein DI535_00940 [Citrobacter freundii]|nr:MAG: hypothetical protein DI535_00940 [Citrobacter freundii]